MNPRHTLTGQLAGGFIESKLTLVLMIAALIFGIWAVLSTPREENPQISMPAAAVQAVLPGAEPDEMEAKVIRPLEAIINQIPGVDHYWSTLWILLLSWWCSSKSERTKKSLWSSLPTVSSAGVPNCRPICLGRG